MSDGLSKGAVAIDADNMVWQLWGFDPRFPDELYWWRLSPAMVHGHADGARRERWDMPASSIIWTGTARRWTAPADPAPPRGDCPDCSCCSRESCDRRRCVVHCPCISG